MGSMLLSGIPSLLVLRTWSSTHCGHSRDVPFKHLIILTPHHSKWMFWCFLSHVQEIILKKDVMQLLVRTLKFSVETKTCLLNALRMGGISQGIWEKYVK